MQKAPASTLERHASDGAASRPKAHAALGSTPLKADEQSIEQNTPLSSTRSVDAISVGHPLQVVGATKPTLVETQGTEPP